MTGDSEGAPRAVLSPNRGVGGPVRLSDQLGVAANSGTALPNYGFAILLPYRSVIAIDIGSKLLILLASPTGFEPVLSP
jgi:hypothetical protein